MKVNDINEQLLNIKSASVYLGLSISRIRYEVFLKRIPHVKIGRNVRFTKVQLDQWIETLKVGGSND